MPHNFNRSLLSLLQEDGVYRLFTQAERDKLAGLTPGTDSETGTYVVNRNADGVVTDIVQTLPGGVLKTSTISRTNDLVSSISVTTSDMSFTRTYTVSRDADGNVQGLTVI